MATAIKHYLASPKSIELPGGVVYNFVVKAYISMAWVEDEDVSTVLAIKKVCCGGTKKRIFFPANENDIRRWTNGGGR